jgi:MFS family permease
VRLLPLVFTLVFGCVAGGVLLSKGGYYSPFFILGTALALIGSALFHTVTLDTSAAKIYGYSVLIGLGTGMFIQAGFAIAQAKVPKDQIAAATGFIALGQVTGPLIALSIAGTVLINTATSGLTALLPNAPEQEIKNAIAGTAGPLLSGLTPETRTAALTVIVDSIGKVYILAIAATSLGFVCSLLLRHERVVV